MRFALVFALGLAACSSETVSPARDASSDTAAVDTSPVQIDAPADRGIGPNDIVGEIPYDRGVPSDAQVDDILDVEFGPLCYREETRPCDCPDGGVGSQSCVLATQTWSECRCAPAQVCEPGRIRNCDCPGGGGALQACLADGTGFGPCMCPGADAGLGVDVVDVADVRDAGDVPPSECVDPERSCSSDDDCAMCSPVRDAGWCCRPYPSGGRCAVLSAGGVCAGRDAGSDVPDTGPEQVYCGDFGFPKRRCTRHSDCAVCRNDSEFSVFCCASPAGYCRPVRVEVGCSAD